MSDGETIIKVNDPCYTLRIGRWEFSISRVVEEGGINLLKKAFESDSDG